MPSRLGKIKLQTVVRFALKLAAGQIAGSGAGYGRIEGPRIVLIAERVDHHGKRDRKAGIGLAKEKADVDRFAGTSGEGHIGLGSGRGKLYIGGLAAIELLGLESRESQGEQRGKWKETP